MKTADLLALIESADGEFIYEQFRSWVVAQSIRNALETFHGRWAFDPDNPGSGEGFISDDQMRVLNITIRRAVHEALRQVDLAQPGRAAIAPPGTACRAAGSAGILRVPARDDARLHGAAGLARARAGVPAVRQLARRQPVNPDPRLDTPPAPARLHR